MEGSVFFNVGLGVVGTAVLIVSGMLVVRSLSVIARYLHFSEFVLSFVLISFATSLPELAVGLRSSLSGVPQLSLGDILGTNIVNLTLILGLVAILGKRLELKDYEHFKNGRLFTLVAVLLPFVLLLDGELGRTDGMLLLAFFVFNMVRMLREQDLVVEKKIFRPHLHRHAHHSVSSRRAFLKYVFIFIAAVPLLLLSAEAMVTAARNLSFALGLPEFILGLFLISIGTSLPEMTIGVRSAIVHKVGVSLGDLFGSAVFNSTLILGIVSLIHPITVSGLAVPEITGAFMAGVMILIYFFLRKRNVLYRQEGFILLGAYIIFLVLQYSLLGSLGVDPALH